MSYLGTALKNQIINVVREYPKSVTFIPDSPIGISNFHSIIDPIIHLGEEADLDFEILLPSVRGDDDALKVSMEKYDERISIYPVGSKSGTLTFLTELSSTPYISFFSSAIPTDLWIADIISEYFVRSERRLLLSDISVFPRSLLITTGGIGNIGKYSLMDFYGRIAAISGVVACTTKNRSLSFFNPEFSDSLFSSDIVQGEGFTIKDLKYLKKGANLNNGDIFLMLKESGMRKRIVSYFKSILGKPPKRTQGTRHFMERTGYVKLMESIIESIIFTDFLNFVPSEREIRIKIGKPEIKLMERRSKVWSRSMETIGKFLILEST